MQIQRIRLVSLGLFLLALVACASGPLPDVQKSNVPTPDAPGPKNITIPFGPGMTRPSQIGGPTPSLPPEAIANHVTGSWIGRCIITENGSVEGCEVAKGLPYSDEHIIQVLQAQKYAPVIFERRPQSVWYTFKITFIEPITPQQL